jgi:hypothetical protein
VLPVAADGPLAAVRAAHDADTIHPDVFGVLPDDRLADAILARFEGDAAEVHALRVRPVNRGLRAATRQHWQQPVSRHACIGHRESQRDWLWERQRADDVPIWHEAEHCKRLGVVQRLLDVVARIEHRHGRRQFGSDRIDRRFEDDEIVADGVEVHSAPVDFKSATGATSLRGHAGQSPAKKNSTGDAAATLYDCRDREANSFEHLDIARDGSLRTLQLPRELLQRPALTAKRNEHAPLANELRAAHAVARLERFHAFAAFRFPRFAYRAGSFAPSQSVPTSVPAGYGSNDAPSSSPVLYVSSRAPHSTQLWYVSPGTASDVVKSAATCAVPIMAGRAPC